MPAAISSRISNSSRTARLVRRRRTGIVCLAIFAAIRNDPPFDRLALADPEMKIMSDQFQPPPYVYDGLDPVRERKSIFAEATEVMNSVITYIGDAIERGRKPGMPLSILSNVTREAPLGSLLAAFLLGAAVARRWSRR
jgi:hypothetical protein